MRLESLAPIRISIHALREEGDCSGLAALGIILNFYPRPPRGGRQKGTVPLQQDDAISIHALREGCPNCL